MKTTELVLILFALFLLVILSASLFTTTPPPIPTEQPDEVKPPRSPEVDDTDFYNHTQNETAIGPIESENMTVSSTELIDYSSMNAGDISSFVGRLSTQGIPELTLRIPAYSDGGDAGRT